MALYSLEQREPLLTVVFLHPRQKPRGAEASRFPAHDPGLLIFPKEKGVDEETKDKGQVAASHLLK